MMSIRTSISMSVCVALESQAASICEWASTAPVYVTLSSRQSTQADVRSRHVYNGSLTLQYITLN